MQCIDQKTNKFFVLWLKKSDCSNKAIISEINSILRVHGNQNISYAYSENESIKLDELSTFFKSFDFEEIKKIFKGYPIIPMLETEQVRDDNENIYFDGKSRYEETIVNNQEVYEPVPPSFNNKSLAWEDKFENLSSSFSHIKTKKGNVAERGKGQSLINLKLRAKI